MYSRMTALDASFKEVEGETKEGISCFYGSVTSTYTLS